MCKKYYVLLNTLIFFSISNW